MQLARSEMVTLNLPRRSSWEKVQTDGQTDSHRLTNTRKHSLSHILVRRRELANLASFKNQITPNKNFRLAPCVRVVRMIYNRGSIDSCAFDFLFEFEIDYLFKAVQPVSLIEILFWTLKIKYNINSNYMGYFFYCVYLT